MDVEHTIPKEEQQFRLNLRTIIVPRLQNLDRLVKNFDYQPCQSYQLLQNHNLLKGLEMSIKLYVLIER